MSYIPQMDFARKHWPGMVWGAVIVWAIIATSNQSPSRPTQSYPTRYAPTAVRAPVDLLAPENTWVAENGSYYGEISTNTGRPKTVHVDGYYRTDGTYVREHFRSPPRSGAGSRGGSRGN
jgi:hypothetical protein